MRYPNQTAATSAVLAALLLTGISLSACGPEASNDEPGGLPRDTTPMTVPAQPAQPDEPVDSTLPPRPTTAPESPAELPPQPIGRSEIDPASNPRSAGFAAGQFSVDAGAGAANLAARARSIECAELHLTKALYEMRSRWTEPCIVA